MSDKTHFGYQTIDASEKVQRVGEVFSSVARNYDIMNDVMSFGIHRIWKKITINHAKLRKGESVLDLASGTGDLARAYLEAVGSQGRVVMTDINPDMLAEGRKRCLQLGVAHKLEFAIVNAEQIPFEDNSFDCVSISFGLRNVTDKDQALREMHRILKPGGRALILEFSQTNELVKPFYDFYSFNILPKMGKLIANDEESYQYLAESIRMHPDQKTLKSMMDNAGFGQTSYMDLTFGICAVHRGYKLS
jgi:demethylmenaquinone methyltransferase/2-methoxy-6-polyprenyl-1,4-benzoquinol methylase